MSTTMLEGKVGRMYLPQQGVDNIALHKMKVGAVRLYSGSVLGSVPHGWAVLRH